MIKIIAAIAVYVLINILSLFATRGLQMCGYRINEYKFELIDMGNRLAYIVGVGGVCAIICIVNMFIGLAFSILFCMFGAIAFYKEYNKFRTKISFTKRAMRLYVSSSILIILLILVALFAISDSYYAIMLFAISVLGQFSPFLCAVILSPFETANNNRYIEKAKAKIARLDAIKIGITGSYGKTSCKNILYEMLKDKYIVLKTEKNHNTPMGLALTSKNIVGNEEIFIAEMGARHLGDITTLCNIVKPTIGIITGITKQHLDTFYNEYNIYKAKRELVEALPVDGFAVFNGDCKLSLAMSEDAKLEYKCVSRCGQGDVYAKDIRLTNAGSSFNICGLGDTFKVTTHLLGRHNITNILLCATIASYLGIPNTAIIKSVARLRATPHRLELITSKHGVTIIDDSYNCNVEGAKFALEVISLFDGRKIVMTQGIVEQGDNAFESNKNLGILIAEKADLCIVIGKNSTYILEGLQIVGFEPENILTYNTLQDAQEELTEILKSGDILLIQNDIP